MSDNAITREQQEQAPGLRQLLGGLVLVVLTVLAVLFAVRHVQASAPYIQDVLALNGKMDRGHEIFQMNCAVCHGLEAHGEIGPSLLGVSARKSKVNLIKQVISGNTPPMPQFQPNPQDMADLLEYLETL